MKGAAGIVLAVLFTILFAGSCAEDEVAPIGPENGDDPLGRVVGTVHSGDRSDPLAGASVTVAGITTETDARGRFAVPYVPVGGATVVIEHSGYLAVQRPVTVFASETSYLDLTVLLPTEIGSVPAQQGGAVPASNGNGAVIFAPNSFETSDGEPYEGDVTVEFAFVLPGDGSFHQAFPGRFAGIDQGGHVVPFVSWGFLGVTITGEDRAPLVLAEGETAEYRIRVDEQFARAAPDTIPIWYGIFFERGDELWREDGIAIKDGDEFSAEVSHFSLWNLGMPVELCAIEGQVVGETGEPVAGARVVARGLDVTYRDETLSDESGFFSVGAIQNTQALVWAVNGQYAGGVTTIAVGDDCPAQLAEPLTVRNRRFRISLNWGASPDDLDLRLFVPMTWDEGWDFYQIRFNNPGSVVGDPYTILDGDDTEGFGPEIINAFALYRGDVEDDQGQIAEGSYACWVRHPNLYPGDVSLPASSATVTLRLPGIEQSFEAADATGSEVQSWHVFDFTVEEDGSVTVTPVNAFEDWDSAYDGYDVFTGYGREGSVLTM